MTKQNKLQLDEKLGYFRNAGVNVMAFDDIYPEGHQSGVSVLMHGRRIATCGDLRFEPTPGQWQPVPKQIRRITDPEANSIVTDLRFPDEERNLRGLNPMIYPDVELEYRVTVQGEGESAVIEVDLQSPVPETFRGKLCFNLELFPGVLFGKPWIMDSQSGVFPRQPNGPVRNQPSNIRFSGSQKQNLKMKPSADLKKLLGDESEYNPIVADDWIAEPYAEGRVLTICPDDDYTRMKVECLSDDADLKLYDGRMNHNNGWFVVSSEIPAGRSSGALRWRITPHAVPDWHSRSVIQVSQVGYHPEQAKCAVMELDPDVSIPSSAELHRITSDGEVPAETFPVKPWGRFLRYQYCHIDFSSVSEEGLYRLCCGDAVSTLFRISRDVYDRGIWQPVLEYFLPVQMCHMRVQEKYRVWHGLCHNDDACMAPANLNHFDNYVQQDSTYSSFKSGDRVPGLNVGGWHDAGDYDLRVESQSGEVYILAMAREAFGVDYDATTIDQKRRIVEIHQPDGKNDILQQIEHGMLSLVGGWKALGRLYRGIICRSLRQYVLLGDASVMTDGKPGDDDRWVFTEDNPFREFTAAAHMAAGARVLRGFNDELAADGLKAAEAIFRDTTYPEKDERARCAKIHAAEELFLTTRGGIYRNWLTEETDFIVSHFDQVGWIAAKVMDELADETFSEKIRKAVPGLKAELDKLSAETPYGIPYKPYIWGAGWGIQAMAFRYYYLHKAFPDVFDTSFLENALHFVLGCHPGSNTASFASGVGTRSATVAYGANRGDWSYIPGGVISGTALIRPDFPELLEYPFLWQQTEYVLGGGSSNFMFLTLAVNSSLH